MNDWEGIVADAANSGVYTIPETGLHDAEAAARAAGLGLFCLDLGGLRDKAGFLEAAAEALRFPDYFGRNWDAFEECLTDLSWLDVEGFFLVIRNPENFARRAPRSWRSARAILRDAAAFWRGQNIRFFVGINRDARR